MIKKWQQLSPKTKRVVVVGAILAVIVLALMLTDDKKEEPKNTGRQNEVIRHVLTDTDTRTASLDALTSELRNTTRQLMQMDRDLQRMKDLINDETGQKKAQREDEQVKLEARLEGLEQSISELAEQGIPARMDGEDMDVDYQGDDRPSYVPQQRKDFSGGSSSQIDLSKPDEIFERRAPVIPHDSNASTTATKEKKRLTISTIAEEVEAVENDSNETEKDGQDLYLPAGSIVTGVLINGLDAPTGQGARRDPFPATIRVKKEAILPNRFRADIRECFLIVSGYGDLSSERAYLRGETLSCVREDGSIIESSLDSYVVGEDGKAGVRGRLVSKQGQIIAKSLLAGSLSGLSKAFDVKPVPILDTSGSGGYQRNQPNMDWLQSSAVSGASTALDRIANFYLEMADGMFPVVEIDAGRQVDIIVNRGSKLQIKSGK